MADDVEDISCTRLVYRTGVRHAYLGDVPEPVVYGCRAPCASASVRGGWSRERSY
jgi:hypothetical protein